MSSHDKGNQTTTASCKDKILHTQRRRIECVEKNFSGEIFYLDSKRITSVLLLELERDIKLLGGEVDHFLSKAVTIVVTDKKAARNFQSSNSSIIGSTTACGPLSRVQSLVAKSNASPTTNNTISTAKRLGIRVVDNTKFMNTVRKKIARCNLKALWSQQQIEAGINYSRKKFKVKQLVDDYLKHEDYSRQYRPVFGKLTKRPLLYFEPSYGRCPFESSIKPCVYDFHAEVKTNHMPSQMKKRALKRKQENTVKWGYCESCNFNYTDLSKHLQSKIHCDFVENSENFALLDACISSLPSLSDCVPNINKVLPAKSVRTQPADISAKSSEIDSSVFEHQTAAHGTADYALRDTASALGGVAVDTAYVKTCSNLSSPVPDDSSGHMRYSIDYAIMCLNNDIRMQLRKDDMSPQQLRNYDISAPLQQQEWLHVDAVDRPATNVRLLPNALNCLPLTSQCDTLKRNILIGDDSIRSSCVALASTSHPEVSASTHVNVQQPMFTYSPKCTKLANKSRKRVRCIFDDVSDTKKSKYIWKASIVSDLKMKLSKVASSPKVVSKMDEKTNKNCAIVV